MQIWPPDKILGKEIVYFAIWISNFPNWAGYWCMVRVFVFVYSNGFALIQLRNRKRYRFSSIFFDAMKRVICEYEFQYMQIIGFNYYRKCMFPNLFIHFPLLYKISKLDIHISFGFYHSPFTILCMHSFNFIDVWHDLAIFSFSSLFSFSFPFFNLIIICCCCCWYVCQARSAKRRLRRLMNSYLFTFYESKFKQN